MHVNARKAILPKLWMVLRNGGFGNAATIFHNILPFLSKIPQSVRNALYIIYFSLAKRLYAILLFINY